RVSKAESQLAVPLIITTFFASSVAGSPKGSAACTIPGCGGGAGLWAAAGGADGAGEGLADGVGLAEGAGVGVDAASDVVEAAGAGVVDAAGAGAGGTGAGEAAGAGVAVGDAAGAGDCARAAPTGTAAAMRPAMTRRKAHGWFIFAVSIVANVAASRPAKGVLFLTRKARGRPMTDASCLLRADTG